MQAGAKGDFQGQVKGVGPEGNGLLAVIQGQGNAGFTLGALAALNRFPQGGTGKTVGRLPWV